MALLNITIEKVIVKDDPEIKALLEKIICMLSKDDESLRQQIFDKLQKAISDIKSTV